MRKTVCNLSKGRLNGALVASTKEIPGKERHAKYRCLEGIQIGNWGCVFVTVQAWGKLRREICFLPPDVKTAQLVFQRGKYKILGSIMVNRRNVIACDVREVRSDVSCSNHGT